MIFLSLLTIKSVMNSTRYFVFLGLSLLVLMLSACKINKGFEALEEFNYFEAKKQFEKSLKKQKSAAAYGLSVIYFRNDNPFYDLDSAYHYGLLARSEERRVGKECKFEWVP